MKIFTTNYHISVNKTLIDDLLAVGLEVVMPRDNWNKRIGFYAPNDEHRQAKLVSHQQFMDMEPMAILIPCMQLIGDFMELYNSRGQKDVIIYLTANSDAVKHYDLEGTDYLISHDLDFHRQFKGKYKMLYFSKPTVLRPPKTESELRESYNSRKIKLYINNFDKAGFEPEFEQAKLFRTLWENQTGWRIPFYGYGMPDGWLSMRDTQDQMVNSMFSLVFKRRDTWGQMVNESMMLGTPCAFLERFLYSTFTEYLINKETAVIGSDIADLAEKIYNLSFEQYETLVNEAYSQSYMFCNDSIRHDKLRWLFNKVANDPKLA